MKVGDRVVCVKSNYWEGNAGVIKGRVYVIENIISCSCGSISFDVGVSSITSFTKCHKCGSLDSYPAWLQSASRFAPIQYNSATEELANKEIVKETSDIPIKEPQKEKV